MKVLNYKGYSGELVPDLEAGVLHGRVLGLRAVITFQGDTVPEAIEAFHDSINDYLEACAEDEEEPERPFSGKLPYRTTPERHRRIALAAAERGMSINAWMDAALAEAADREMASPPSETPIAESAVGRTKDIGLGPDATSWTAGSIGPGLALTASTSSPIPFTGAHGPNTRRQLPADDTIDSRVGLRIGTATNVH